MLLDADRLNTDCACISLDRAALLRELDAIVGDPQFGARLAQSHPTLLSNLPVYLRPDHVTRMAAIIGSIEAVAQTPGYQAAALAHAPPIARHTSGAIGVLMGYDFHLGEDGPKLIEINTNAGGALINAVLAKAQSACCAPAATFLPPESREGDAEAAILDSFRREWRNVHAAAPLTSIAIVDADPESQYLYPEFVLFQRLFETHGITAIISPPEQLRHTDGRLWHGEQKIDLVYNRLTDFALESPESAALRAAYLAGDAVVTPNPRAHALFADKRNLVRLTDADVLRGWGVTNEIIEVLARGIPKTIEVMRDRGDALWSRRAALFFKPVSGFGSKAAYRGDKVTRRVWETILAGGYVAQELVPPSTRNVIVDGERQSLKVDIRNYTYAGEVQLIAARLYQGQTTNMRTPGGGFAPVLWNGLVAPSDCCTPAGDAASCCSRIPSDP